MNEKSISDPSQLKAFAKNARFMTLKQPMAEKEISASFSLPKDIGSDATLRYSNWGMEVAAGFSKAESRFSDGEKAAGMMNAGGTLLAIYRGWGELFYGDEGGSVPLPDLLHDNLSTIAAGHGAGGLISAKSLMDDAAEVLIAEGNWPILSKGALSAVVAFIRADGTYSIASFGDFTAYATRDGMVRRILSSDRIIVDGNEMDARETDINDYGKARGSAENEMTSDGLDTGAMIECEGALADGEMLIIGSPGFRRKLWVGFDEMTEAITDVSGVSDITTMLSHGLDGDQAAKAIIDLCAAEAVATMGSDLVSRSDMFEALVSEPVFNDGWALIPDRSATTLIAFKIYGGDGK